VKSGCPHPATARETPNGYDVVCADCQSLVGTVALFPAAVIREGEARELLRMLGDAGENSGVRHKIVRAAVRSSI
jgi:hypothetical protein